MAYRIKRVPADWLHPVVGTPGSAAWLPADPPSGDWFQIYDTVARIPLSPPCESLDALSEHLACYGSYVCQARRSESRGWHLEVARDFVARGGCDGPSWVFNGRRYRLLDEDLYW